MTELIDALPTHSYFRMEFHCRISNGLPFYWKGFQQTTLYTHVLEDLDDMDAVWNGLSGHVRGRIEKARTELNVAQDWPLDRLLEDWEPVFYRDGYRSRFDAELLARLDEACSKHNARKILVAVDPNNRLSAAVYVVWNKNSACFLLGGGMADTPITDADCLLLWEAIRFAAGVTDRFDFGGCMTRARTELFRGFGARQVPYLMVTKDKRNLISRACIRVPSRCAS